MKHALYIGLEQWTKLSIAAFAALALAFTPVQAANLHDNDYADDYQQYKADNDDMSIHDQYMDLMLKSKTAQYCVDTLGIKGGSEWPGSYWEELANEGLKMANVEYPEKAKLYEEFMQLWTGNPLSYEAQYGNEPARVKLQECPWAQEPEFKGAVN